MTWNYRVIKSIDQTGEVNFGIHEVYYDENNIPHSCTAEPIVLTAESIEDLKADLELINKAFSKPVLEMLYFDNMSKNSTLND